MATNPQNIIPGAFGAISFEQELTRWLKHAGRVRVIDKGEQSNLLGGPAGRLYRLYNSAGEFIDVPQAQAERLGLRPSDRRYRQKGAAEQGSMFEVRGERPRRTKALLRLLNATQRITSILDLDHLLEMVVNEVATQFGCLESNILLFDERSGELEVAAVRGCKIHKKGFRFAPGMGLVGACAHSGQTIYTPDVERDPRYIRCEASTRSELQIPLKVEGRVIGVFSAAHPEVDGFPAEQIELLHLLAQHIAVAVENARRFQQEREQRERLRIEQEEARRIQQELLPKSSPLMPGIRVEARWHPAGAAGGDWYDYIPLEGGRWGLVLADVSGKGLAAAMLMTATRGIVRSLACSQGVEPSSTCLADRPAELLARVNKVLLNDFPAGRYVTMVYAVIDPAARTLTFANAGHLLPLLWDGNEVRSLDVRSGLPLGMLASEFDEQTIALPEHFRLLLYTDGITEAFNGSDEEYGTAQLKRMLSEPELNSETLLADVRRFSGGTATDDATLILVQG